MEKNYFTELYMILNEINFILNYSPIKGHKLYSLECTKPLLFLTF